MSDTRSPEPPWSEKSLKVEGLADSHTRLLESPDASPRSLKRDHDTYEGTGLYEPMSVPADFREMIERERAAESNGEPPNHEREVSPARSMTDSVLSDLGTSTPPRERTPSIGAQGNAFAALNGNAAPPAKKQKLTFQEQEMKRINKQIKDRERAEEKERKEVEKLKKEAERQAAAGEKARKESEKEAEKQKKEAERQAAAAEKEAKRQAAADEKAKKEAEKEEKRRKKEEEKNKKEEEKKKATKGQLKMTGFVKLPPPSASRSRATSTERRTASPGPPNSSLAVSIASPSAATTPSKATKPELSAYEKAFPAFFVRDGVKVAPINHFERDNAALETAQKNLDSYILGNRSPGRERHLDPVELFKLPTHQHISRGTRVMPVKEIIEEFYSGKSTRVIDLTTDSQNTQIKQTTSLLRKIPMKFLKFQEDVRPPYQGTYSKRPNSGMTKMAKNPFLKDLPHPTNYDWDSEAEWEEDADAEDLKSEGDEDEEVDDDEDMDGFLDDENDESAKERRLVLQGDLEPICSGLCWEDRKKRNENVKMQMYRLEMILDPTMKSIDPFSTSYWEPTPSQTTSMNPPRIPLNSLKPSSLSHNGSTSSTNASSKNVKTFPPAPSALSATSKPRGRPAAPSDKPKKLIEEKEMHKFKEAIKEYDDMSKIGIIELLKKRFPSQKAAQIKNTLEVVARRVGNKEVEKRWVVIDDEDLDQQMGNTAATPAIGIEAYAVRPDPFSV